MSLAQTFSESFTDPVVISSSPATEWSRETAMAEGSRWPRLRRQLATGVAASLELAFFFGVGGVMAAGALLFR